ncbi:MAG: hypothetical protein ACPGEG_05955 [Salibacteraceae bacterium]
MKLLSVLLLVISLNGFAQDSTEVEWPKHSVYVSLGFKTYGTAINYERQVPLLKSKPLFIFGSLGLGFEGGFGTSISHYINVVPTYIGFGYGNKNRVTAFIGLTHLISWDPTLKTKEEREDYKNNPNSDALYGPVPILPYDNNLNIGLTYRHSFKNNWFLQAEATMVFERWPSYKNTFQWQYISLVTFPLFDVAFGKSF